VSSVIIPEWRRQARKELNGSKGEPRDGKGWVSWSPNPRQKFHKGAKLIRVFPGPEEKRSNKRVGRGKDS